MRLPAFAGLLGCFVAACTVAPRPAAGIVAVRGGRGEALAVVGAVRAPLGALNAEGAARLAQALVPDVPAQPAEDGYDLDYRSERMAGAVFEAIRFADGAILARMHAGSAAGPAGIAAETLRRWLAPPDPDAVPDWTALLAALHDGAVWKTAPTTAALAAVVLAGLVLTGEGGPEAVGAARAHLYRAIAQSEAPDWLSLLAAEATRRALAASDDRP